MYGMMGSMGMGNPAGRVTYDKLSPGGGSMDVMGSLKAHSDSATQYTKKPAGMMGGLFSMNGLFGGQNYSGGY